MQADKSLQAFFSAIDALLTADERPEGISAEDNVARIKPFLQKVVNAGAKTKRAELNSLYAHLGDHFLDDAVAHARLVIQVIDTGDDDKMIKATAAILRWQRWWKPNQKKVMEAIFNQYG